MVSLGLELVKKILIATKPLIDSLPLETSLAVDCSPHIHNKGSSYLGHFPPRSAGLIWGGVRQTVLAVTAVQTPVNTDITHQPGSVCTSIREETRLHTESSVPDILAIWNLDSIRDYRPLDWGCQKTIAPLASDCLGNSLSLKMMIDPVLALQRCYL